MRERTEQWAPRNEVKCKGESRGVDKWPNLVILGGLARGMIYASDAGAELTIRMSAKPRLARRVRLQPILASLLKLVPRFWSAKPAAE